MCGVRGVGVGMIKSVSPSAPNQWMYICMYEWIINNTPNLISLVGLVIYALVNAIGFIEDMNFYKTLSKRDLCSLWIFSDIFYSFPFVGFSSIWSIFLNGPFIGILFTQSNQTKWFFAVVGLLQPSFGVYV